MKISKYILMSIVGCMASLLISCDKNDNPVSDDVSDKDIVSISGLEIKANGLDNGEITMVVGESIQLSSIIYPADASEVKVTWTSSDESVVTVSGTGLMTAVKSGNATVTLQSVAKPDIKATIEVHVIDGTVDVNNDPDKALERYEKIAKISCNSGEYKFRRALSECGFSNVLTKDYISNLADDINDFIAQYK